MAQVPAQCFYLGPFAVYTSPTGMADVNTGIPYLGGTLHEGDYCDLSESEAQQWSIRFGSQLHAGRYRLVHLVTTSTYSTVKFGFPCGWARGQSLAQVALSVTGSGATTDGTYTINSTAAGGTAATALATVISGALSTVQLVYPGANMTSVPTFALTEIAGLAGGASVLAQMADSPNLVGSFDTTACAHISAVRGIFLTTITAAQVAANAWLVIQEEGIAPLYVTTATSATIGNTAWAATAGAVTTNTPAWYIATIGSILDTAAAATLVRVVLDLPVQQG